MPLTVRTSLDAHRVSPTPSRSVMVSTFNSGVVNAGVVNSGVLVTGALVAGALVAGGPVICYHRFSHGAPAIADDEKEGQNKGPSHPFKKIWPPHKMFSTHPWHNWIAHRSSEPRVAGSNPAGCICGFQRNFPAGNAISVASIFKCGPVQKPNLYRKTPVRFSTGALANRLLEMSIPRRH